jgi:hypothetical protein
MKKVKKLRLMVNRFFLATGISCFGPMSVSVITLLFRREVSVDPCS